MVALLLDADEKHTKKKRNWVHPALKRRKLEGEFYTFLPHLAADDTKFWQYFRMSRDKLEINANYKIIAVQLIHMDGQKRIYHKA